MADCFDPFVRNDLYPSDILDTEYTGGWLWTLEETNDGTILRVRDEDRYEFEYLIAQLDDLDGLRDLVIEDDLNKDELDATVKSLGVRILGKNQF